MAEIRPDESSLIPASELGRFIETPEDEKLMVEDLVSKGGNREAIVGLLNKRTSFNSSVSEFAQTAAEEVAQRFPSDNLANIAKKRGETETEIRQEVSAQVRKYLADYLQVGIQTGGKELVLRPDWQEGKYQRKSYDITAAAFDPSKMRDGAMGILEQYLTSLIPLENDLIQGILNGFRENRQTREQLFNQALQAGTIRVDNYGIMSFATAETD